MVRCSVKGCKNYQGKKVQHRKPTRYFCFPKNAKLIREWLRACGEVLNADTRIARVCSDHFVEEDYKLKDILLNVPENKRNLKYEAIPSKNLPNLSGPTECPDMIKAQRQKELVEQAVSSYERKAAIKISSHFEEPEVDNPEAEQSLGQNKFCDDPLAQPGPESMQLTRENQKLRQDIHNLTNRLQKAEAVISSMEQIFTKGQIKRVTNPERKPKWAFEDMSYAASLFSSGPLGYAQLVKRRYPFPSTATLKKWTAAQNLQPGLIECVQEEMATLEWDEKDRLCILSFHEFRLRGYSKTEAKKGGKPYKSAQSVVVRGLAKDWKQVVYYNYDCKKASAIVEKVVQTLKGINFTVVAVVSSIGPLKLPLWFELNISHDRPCAELVDGEKVFFFGNVPQLLKNFRNRFVSKGITVKGNELNVAPLQELLSTDIGVNLQTKGTLTDAHLSKRKINRQNVKLAWELLDKSVASALRTSVSSDKIHSENATECGELIQLFSDWLGVFNAPHTAVEEGEAVKQDKQKKVIKLMDELSITLERGKAPYPFQKGILLNNASLSQLPSYLRQKYNIDCDTTNRLNQDDLELSLGLRKPSTDCGGLPSALEFRYRIHRAVLCNLKEIKSL